MSYIREQYQKIKYTLLGIFETDWKIDLFYWLVVSIFFHDFFFGIIQPKDIYWLVFMVWLSVYRKSQSPLMIRNKGIDPGQSALDKAIEIQKTFLDKKEIKTDSDDFAVPLNLRLIIQPENGCYRGHFEDFPKIISTGETIVEVVDNLKDDLKTSMNKSQ